MNQFVPMILRRFEVRLELTPEQLEKIRPIVKAAGEDLRRLRRANFSDSMAVGEKMNEQIAAILTPGQREKLEAMKREWRERSKIDRARRNWDRDRHPAPPPEDQPPRADDPPPPPN